MPLDLPLWAVGLAIAGLAPFLVGFVVNTIDSITRKRSKRAFELAGNDEGRQSVSRRTS